jgi:hypothetical protein
MCGFNTWYFIEISGSGVIVRQNHFPMAKTKVANQTIVVRFGVFNCIKGEFACCIFGFCRFCVFVLLI